MVIDFVDVMKNEGAFFYLTGQTLLERYEEQIWSLVGGTTSAEADVINQFVYRW